MSIRKNIVLCSLCILGLCLGIFSCKTSESDPNVWNGKTDIDNKFPAVLHIEMIGSDGIKYSCTSSVISHNTLLTAAHCLYERKNVEVILGEKKKIPAKNTYIMDGYHPPIDGDTLENTDIGIVVFDDNTFKDITPLKISNQQLNKGDSVIFVGYAGSNERKWGISGPIIEDPKDVDGLIITQTLLILDLEGKGRYAFVMPGDSGGPVISYHNQNLILGVASEWVRKINQIGNIIIKTQHCGFVKASIDWLRKIDKETNANIPLDEIK